MQTNPFLRSGGAALLGAGFLVFLVNALLTPMVPRAAFAETAASAAFLWRQSLSALAGVLLLFATIGTFLRHSSRAGSFAAIAFGLAFTGSALLVASEWSEVFLVRDLALRAPDALRALDGGTHPTLYDLGAMLALGSFTLGWIALAATALRGGRTARSGATLVIAGFFAIPLLGALLPRVVGAASGNAILGTGWFMLGLDLVRAGKSAAAGR